jgi:BlaI family penicillinase repressor
LSSRSRKVAPLGSLTAAEYQVMDVLWKRDSATVAEVVARLRKPLAYTTVLTMLRVLEKKGFVDHTVSNRSFVYRARVERAAALHQPVKQLVSAFFSGSPKLAMLHLAEHAISDQQKLQTLRKLIGAEAKGDA